MTRNVYRHLISDFFAVRWDHPIPALRTYFRELLMEEARDAADHNGCAEFMVVDASGHCVATGYTFAGNTKFHPHH